MMARIANLMLWLFSRLGRSVLVSAPQLLANLTPQSSNMLSISVLYIFAQAMGMIWLLVINILSKYSMLVAEWLTSVCGPASTWGATTCPSAIQLLAQSYRCRSTASAAPSRLSVLLPLVLSLSVGAAVDASISR